MRISTPAQKVVVVACLLLVSPFIGIGLGSLLWKGTIMIRFLVLYASIYIVYQFILLRHTILSRKAIVVIETVSFIEIALSGWLASSSEGYYELGAILGNICSQR